MQNATTELTQKERLGEELQALAPDVTKKDRSAYVNEIKKSYTTLSNYLNGKVSDLDTATEMITFLKKKIADRAKKALA